MGKVLCIYHANCADGLLAAWAVYKALGDDVEFVAANYGGNHLDIRLRTIGGISYVDRDVLYVDFSDPLPPLRAMAAEARSVLVLDHHKTAREDLAMLKEPPITLKGWLSGPIQFGPNYRAIFDLERSGAGITWDYLHPAERCHHTRKALTGPCPTCGARFDENGKQIHPRPRIIDLVEDRDLWKFRFGDETRAFHAVLTSYDITDLPVMFEWLDRWDAAFRRHNFISGDVHISREHPTPTIWETICSEGMAILRAQRQAVASAVAASRRTMRIAGHTVPVANVPPAMASDAGHLLCDSDSVQLALERPKELLATDGYYGAFSATYYDGADGRRHFSLRSPEGGADCGAIAKRMAEHFNSQGHQIPSGNPEWVETTHWFKKPWTGGGHEHAAGFDAPLGWEGE